MKRVSVLIAIILFAVVMQLPAEGTAEMNWYAKDIFERNDSVSLYLQDMLKSHSLQNGPLKIQIIPMSSETYVYSLYPDMKARRYDYGQMKSNVLPLVRIMDDFWDAEKLLHRMFIMIMKYEQTDNDSGPDSFIINENLFDYIFMDNDKGNFLRVYDHSLEDFFILDEKNNVCAIMVLFGQDWLDNETLKFIQETEKISISMNAFGLEDQFIEFELPLDSLYKNIPEAPKQFLIQLRSELTITFHGADIPPYQNQLLNSIIPEPSVPIKEGHDFKGWYTDKYFSSEWVFSNDKLRNDITLYAKWTPISYLINLKFGNDTIQTFSVNYGQAIKENQILTRQGYKLEGLYLDPYYLKKWDINKDKVEKDTTLYTKWDKIFPVFKIANGAKPISLDPHKIQAVPEHRIYKAIFEGLIIYDPVTAEGIPGLAESWTISEDGTRYTFKLRDATWSDGVKITAQTVVDSWLRGLAPETASPYAWFPAMFLEGAENYNEGLARKEAVGIRALDEKTFQMDLIGKLPYVIDALGHYSFAVVPMHVIKKYGPTWTQPKNFVGNGPFTLKEWSPRSRIVATKNDKYWDADNVKLGEVIFYPIEDNKTAYDMYLNGKIDWLTNIPFDQFNVASLRKDYHKAPQLATYYYVFQTEKPPFDDVRVRKALSISFDRQALIEQVIRGGQIPAWGIVPEMAGYASLGEPVHDVALARKFLAEAGYPNGRGFPKVTILYNTDSGHKAIAEYLQREWKKNLNINVELENQEWATYLSRRNTGDFQVSRAGWVGDFQDPITFLDMFITGAGMNNGRYSNEVFDALLHEATLTKGTDRMEILMTAEDILINEDQAIMNIYYYTTNNLVDTSKWGGWHTNTMDYHPIKNIYLK